MVFTAGGAQFLLGLPEENACPEVLLLACLGHVTGLWNEECERYAAGVERGRTLLGSASGVQAQLLTAKADYFPLYSHAPPRESAQSNRSVSKLPAPHLIPRLGLHPHLVGKPYLPCGEHSPELLRRIWPLALTIFSWR